VLCRSISSFAVFGKEGALELRKEDAATYVVEALRVHQKHSAVVGTIVNALEYLGDGGEVSASMRNAGGVELCQSVIDDEDLPLRVRRGAVEALERITRKW